LLGLKPHCGSGTQSSSGEFDIVMAFTMPQIPVFLQPMRQKQTNKKKKLVGVIVFEREKKKKDKRKTVSVWNLSFI
jgi:hypothetical protein